MPKKSKQNSAEEFDHQEQNSVFDFLYQDVERVGSFLGQLDPDGYLTVLKRSAQLSRAASSRAVFEATGGIPAVANAKGSAHEEDNQSWAKGAERSYDPLWGNALALLDILDQRNLISRDISESALGQIVLFIGFVWVVSTTFLKQILDAPVLKRELKKAISSSNKGAKSNSNSLSPEEIAIELISILPCGVQAHMVGENGAVWCGLKESGLTTAPGTILLNHGSHISGQWMLLGVLDALPSLGFQAPSPFFEEGILKGMAGLADIARPLLGRPAHAYGMTPLLIFRKVDSRPPVSETN